MRKSVIPFFFKQKLNRKLFFIQLIIILIPVSITGVVQYTSPDLSMVALSISVFIALSGILYYLNQNITMPLYAMEKTVEQLADGNLSESLPETGLSEISSICCHINDFSVNQQEMLLHFWNQSVDTIRALDMIASELKNTSKTEARKLMGLLEVLRQTHTMLEKFSYFDVHTSDGEALAATETDHGRYL